MTIYASPRGRARHDCRIEVSLTHGRTMEIGNTAVAGVRPAPRLIEGSLQPADMQVVEAWSRLNEAVISHRYRMHRQPDRHRFRHNARGSPEQMRSSSNLRQKQALSAGPSVRLTSGPSPSSGETKGTLIVCRSFHQSKAGGPRAGDACEAAEKLAEYTVRPAWKRPGPAWRWSWYGRP